MMAMADNGTGDVQQEGKATMGMYLNPGPAMFRQGRNSSTYVDKSMLIAHLNRVLNTERKYACVSRPRRFGKSMAANMVSAYYDRTVDSPREFAGLQITADPSFTSNVSHYDVIKLNMQDFLSMRGSVSGLIANLQAEVCPEIIEAYPDVRFRENDGLPLAMGRIFAQTGRQFVIVIDEWDCVMRERAASQDDQERYLDFLRTWLKDKPYVALCYMTGILPVKKYGTHSALNMFDEYSMLEPLELANSMGFTEGEVETLCTTWGRDLSECKAWYDGYLLPEVGSIFAPRSVIVALETGRFGSYWTQTETFEALQRYIDMDMDGLHSKVVELIGGAHVPIDTGSYSNDMTTLGKADDVLTLLVHLGYLAYDANAGEAFIPNREIAGQFETCVSGNGNWHEIARSISASEDLLDALLREDGTAVAVGLEKAHTDVASIISYNHEEDLACTLHLAFFSAIRRYRLVREAPAGKGYADLLMIPLASSGNIPGVIVELKWGPSAQEAVAQIRERNYAQAFAGTSAEHNLILAGIAYDPKTKQHSCVIEKC